MAGGLVITRDLILSTARTLPAAPQVISGLCEMLQDINTDLDQIADQIRMDSVLAARVIRMSNSIVFGGGGRVGSVDEAVNRVGFAEVLRLVGAATVTGLVDTSLTSYGIGVGRLRATLLLHALASEALAGYTPIDTRTAYAGGLLRGLGMMVLNRLATGRLSATEVFDPKQFESYSDWEMVRFGVTSTEVTTMILDEWQFPAELVAAVERHLMRDDSANGEPFACILNLAGVVVADAGLALAGEAKFWVLAPEKLAGAGLDEEDFQKAAARAREVFESQRRALY